MRPRLLLAAACLVAVLVFAGSVVAGSVRVLDRSTSDRPDEAVGPQIHAIYALPSDAQDGALDTNGAIGSWLSLFNDWLAQQSGGSRLRVDTFQGVADVSFVRLPQTTAELSADDRATWVSLYSALPTQYGFNDATKKYAVVLAAGSGTLCGLGGGQLAVLFVNACDGVSWVWVIGHEIFHTLGAVDPCAAHPSGNGHVTDVQNDLMWPYAPQPGVTPVLDPGHDDYWGPPGDNHLPAGCPASANVANSDWLTSEPFYRLTVQAGANGTAFVRTQTGFQEQCDADGPCVEVAKGGVQYELSVQADDGFRFAGWTGGGCTEEECTVTVSADTTVTASFVAEPKLTLAVRGTGRVTVPSLTSSCSRACTYSLPYQAATELRATPAKGWRFAGWSGACSGKATSCSVTLSADGSETATFAKVKAKPLPLCAKGKKSTAKHPCRRR